MVSNGEKPSVISALMKYQSTERLRQAVNDAMDLHGGRGICDGPSNYLQSAYQMVPVGITVEGANILTRSLITFAQGALRAHPFLYAEIQAAQSDDRSAGLDQFDKAFAGHVGFTVSNVFGALFHNLTGGLFGRLPSEAAGNAMWYRQLSRGSRNFALVADLTVALLGGGLKVKQKLTGRLSDALSELYFVACALKRFEDDGRPADDRAVVALVAQNGLYRFQQALRGTIDNFPVAPARILMRWLVFPLGTHYKPAPDAVGHKIVRMAIEPGEFRDRLTRDIFVSKDPNDPTGILEVTMEKVVAAEEAERKLERAIRAGTVRRFHGIDWLADAVEKNVLTQDEAQQPARGRRADSASHCRGPFRSGRSQTKLCQSRPQLPRGAKRGRRMIREQSGFNAERRRECLKCRSRLQIGASASIRKRLPGRFSTGRAKAPIRSGAGR